MLARMNQTKVQQWVGQQIVSSIMWQITFSNQQNNGQLYWVMSNELVKLLKV